MEAGVEEEERKEEEEEEEGVERRWSSRVSESARRYLNSTIGLMLENAAREALPMRGEEHEGTGDEEWEQGSAREGDLTSSARGQLRLTLEHVLHEAWATAGALLDSSRSSSASSHVPSESACSLSASPRNVAHEPARGSQGRAPVSLPGASEVCSSARSSSSKRSTISVSSWRGDGGGGSWDRFLEVIHISSLSRLVGYILSVEGYPLHVPGAGRAG